MNSLQDPSKKTSINSLLNPQEASAFPAQLSPSIPPNQAHPHDHHSNAVYASSYPNNTSFHLRAASWDISDDLAKRKHDNGTAQHRHYQQSSVTPQQMYADPSAPRLIRQRIDPPSQYSVEGQPWNSQQDVSDMNNYNAPVISPMYSGERSTAMSNDYQQHNNYNQSYQEQPTSSIPPASEWQKTERVSVRLSARASLADHHHQVQQQQQQHQQHPQHQHHPSHHHTQPHPSHHQSHSSSQSHQLGSHQQHGRYNTHPSYYPQHGAYAMSSFPSSHHTQPLSPQGGPQPPPQVPPQPQNPEATSKRPLPDADSAPVKKRSRAKKTVGSEATPGPSRRGYNAKKRSEAAQIAAQNAHLIPTVSYTQVPSEKGKGKDSDVRMQMTTGESTNGEAITAPLHPELQFARCMSNRYRSEQFPRCVSCTRRWAGDTCRFQGIRFFLKDQNRNIVGISFVETQKADAPTMNFPSRWNIPFTMEHIKRTKKVITQAILPTLRAELEHLKLPEIIRRPRECEVRATCDTCMTSLFSSSWMCRLCGREACGECFAQVRELTTDKPGATPGEIAALQAKRDRHAHSNPFFLSCTRRNEHQEKDFSPMSRFCREELEDAIKEMEELSLGGEKDGESGANDVNGSGSSSSLAGAVPATVNGSSDASLDPDNTADPAFQPMHLPEITASIPSHPIRRYSDAELASTDKFARIWALGEPLVISNVLSRFKLQWTPDYFMEKYKEQSCLIMECQTDQNKRVTVGEFFGWFGQYEGRKECWKLKDWPPSTDFKTAFPELYEDFSQAVPIPDYVRRDGVYNIGSHFPSNSVGPDLGPKMYNAMASSFSAGSKGSTKLHMDMADALNIMTYAAPCANGTPGYAAWDLFRAEDSDRLRSFLKRKFGTTNTDPIHTQTHYLDETLRDQLWKEAGVLSYRVYQRPGEAVFIPAGCAHQVANMSDCMKVAIDYVSPENIARCERLTKEFREQNQSMAWKEDVLQLRTMMWFAWLSCCQQERQLNELKGVKVPPGVGEAVATD